MFGYEIGDAFVLRAISAVGILVFFALLALLSRIVVRIVLSKMRRNEDHGIPEIILECVKGPVSFFLLSVGILIAYLLAIEIDNEFFWAHYNLGTTFKKINEFIKSMNCYE